MHAFPTAPANLTTPTARLAWAFTMSKIIDAATGLVRPMALGTCIVATVDEEHNIAVAVERADEFASQSAEDGAADFAAELRAHAAAGHLAVVVFDKPGKCIATSYFTGTINARGGKA